MQDTNPRLGDHLERVDPRNLLAPDQVPSRQPDPRLVADIAEAGVREPLLVGQLLDGSLFLIDGHRRARAAIQAGQDSVPVVIPAHIGAGYLIQELITQAGVSQAELARRSGVDRTLLNTYIRGARRPGDKIWGKLAVALHVRPARLAQLRAVIERHRQALVFVTPKTVRWLSGVSNDTSWAQPELRHELRDWNDLTTSTPPPDAHGSPRAELLSQIEDLTESEAQRVLDFLNGLKMNRPARNRKHADGR